MGSPRCSKEGLNRGAWTAAEDNILVSYIKTHGEGKWRTIPKRAGLKRCGKSCRLRWLNYLRPDIKRGNISDDEEDLIIRLHNLLGNRWSLIAGRLPGRTDNEIKNYWNTTLGKKVQGKCSNSLPKPNATSKSKGKRPINQASLPEDSTTDKTNIVRTKASRCTKVIIHDQDPMIIPIGSQQQPLDFETTKPNDGHRYPSLDFDLGDMSMMCDLDFSLLDALGNGIYVGEDADMTGKDDGTSNINLSQSMSSSNGDLSFNDAMLEDWLSNDCFQPDGASDLQSFAYILDAEAEWAMRTRTCDD